MLDTGGNCSGFWLGGGELDSMSQELQSAMPVVRRSASASVEVVQLPDGYLEFFIALARRQR